MRKLLLSHLFVLFILTLPLAQLDFRVIADNIVLSNGSSSAALIIIENSTKNIIRHINIQGRANGDEFNP